MTIVWAKRSHISHGWKRSSENRQARSKIAGCTGIRSEVRLSNCWTTWKPVPSIVVNQKILAKLQCHEIKIIWEVQITESLRQISRTIKPRVIPRAALQHKKILNHCDHHQTSTSLYVQANISTPTISANPKAYLTLHNTSTIQKHTNSRHPLLDGRYH